MTNNKENILSFSNSEFGKIRTIVIDEEPWFVGKDVATALGYSNASKAVSVHVDKEDKKFIMLDIADSQNGNVLKGKSKTSIINESGMYALIFNSKLESAKRFKHWVTSEVLPAIRKTGKYEQPQPESRELVMAKGLIAANEMIQEQKQTIADQQILIEQQQDRIEDLEETEKDWKLLMDAEGSFSINQLSQFINIGEYKLFKYLRDFKLLFKNENNDNVPYRKYLQTGKFIVVPAVAPNGVTHSQTRVLPEGIPVITNLLRKNAVLA